MEAILYIVGIYGGIYLIGWIISKLFSLFEKHREKIRDQAANDLLKELNVNPDELISVYKQRLKDIKFVRENAVEKYFKSIYRKRRYSELQGKCPECTEGYLRVKAGKYGKFLGCSRWPICKYSLNLQTAKQQYKMNIMDEFMEDFNKAYSK